MTIGLTYGVPGTATYSTTLSGLDAIMSVIPDNNINQITARTLRDVSLTMYQMLASGYSNLTNVTSNGNTTSIPIQIGGLQVSGTTSLLKNLNLKSTISDINGATGTNGQILSSVNNGVQWINNIQPTLQSITNVGSTTSNDISTGAINVKSSDNALNVAINIASASFYTQDNIPVFYSTYNYGFKLNDGTKNNYFIFDKFGRFNIGNTGSSSPTLNRDEKLQVIGDAYISATMTANSIKTNYFIDSIGSTGTDGQILSKYNNTLKWNNNISTNVSSLAPIVTQISATYSSATAGFYVTANPTGNVLQGSLATSADVAAGVTYSFIATITIPGPTGISAARFISFDVSVSTLGYPSGYYCSRYTKLSYNFLAGDSFSSNLIGATSVDIKNDTLGLINLPTIDISTANKIKMVQKVTARSIFDQGFMQQVSYTIMIIY